MASYRVLDIETVPDLTCWTPPPSKFTWKGDSRPLDEVRATGLQSPYLEEEKPFPPPQAHRIVSMAWVDLDEVNGLYYQFTGAYSIGKWGSDPSSMDREERFLLSFFSEQQTRDGALIVTWNGRTFDLPVINLRSFRHGIPLPWYYRTDGMRYRYSEIGHCDLMDVFSDYGAARTMKLGDVARCMGLPGKSGEITGSDVAEVVSRGTDEKLFSMVNSYCMSDAIQTALVFVRSRYHKGMINVEEYNDAVASFAGVCRQHQIDTDSLMVRI